MSRIYATRDDDGRKILVALQCDSCGAEVKPNPLISESGWTKIGMDNGPGTDKMEWYYCPDCSSVR